GLSQDRPATGQELRNRVGQGCGPARAGQALSTRFSRRWTFLAHLAWAREGLAVERRPVSNRIDSAQDTLGFGRDGCLYAADYRFWRAGRWRGWSGSLLHV